MVAHARHPAAMDLHAHPVFASLLWYEKVTLLFALFYPVLGILMARRRLASGQGSVVALATLPLTAGAVVFWLGLADVNGDTRIHGWEGPLVASFGPAVLPLFVACLSTLLVLAGSLPDRTGGEGRPRSTRLTSIVIGAPFVLAAAGFAYSFLLRRMPALPSLLASVVLGTALIGLHVLTLNLRMPPESRTKAAAVFVLTVLLAWATWQFGQEFQVQE